MSSLFSVTNNPSLLPQLVREAKEGLESAPKIFKPLEQLTHFFGEGTPDFGATLPIAIKILNNEAFQDYPGSLRRLQPLAERFVERSDQISLALEQPSEEELRPFISGLSQAHRAFHNQYIVEYEQIRPYEPFTILNKYPKTISLYLTAFFKQLGSVSGEQYRVWKESVIERDPDLLPIFSRLAIHHLLENGRVQIPELLDEEKIDELRGFYNRLTYEQKRELSSSLGKGELSTDLARQIATYASLIQFERQRQSFNGVSRFVYEEAAKAFRLLEQMDLKEYPHHLKTKFQVLFLALLKQERITEENLPLIFSNQKIKEQILTAFQKYQALSDEEKSEFERVILAGKEDSNKLPIYDLLQDGKELFSQSSFDPIPIHLLAEIAYRRNSIYSERALHSF